jgi:hypothetical protein
MIKKGVCVEETDEVEVKLSADGKGVISIGVRINGTDECVLASAVTLPEPGRFKSWKKKMKDLV